MQLFSRNKALAALSLGALAALGACGDDVTVPVAPAAPVVISITPPSASMNIGESLNFAVQISGGSTTAAPTLASCTSSNAAVATAAVQGSACRVTAVAAGNATVTAAASTGQVAAASVTVSAPAPAITSLAVSPSAAQLGVGQNVTLVPTVQPAGRTVTYSYTTSSATVATVANGVVTAVAPGVATITVTATAAAQNGFAAATINQAVTITVSERTPGLTALQVSPSSASLPVGGKQQLTAAVQGPRASAATITYGTSAPSIATVSATGEITAVAAGTATITVTAQSAESGAFAASSITGLVAVTVSPNAQVVITSLTKNGSTIDIADVKGQFEVNLAVRPNGQTVQSVQAWVCGPTEAVAACAARTNGVPAAQQTFAASGAQEATAQLYINSAEFTTPDFASGADANTLYKNGLRTIVATVTTTPAASTTIASNNISSVNFNNSDGFTISWTLPSRKANDAAGNTWYGGPAAEGRGSFTVVPVLYTPNRTINQVTLNPAASGACGGDIIDNTRPFRATYGVQTYDSATVAFDCTGVATNLNGHAPRVIASLDNNNAAGPTATGGTAGPAVSIFGSITASGGNKYYQSLAYQGTSIFVPADWEAPAIRGYDVRGGGGSDATTYGDSAWVNGNYQMAGGFAANGNPTRLVVDDNASNSTPAIGVGLLGSGSTTSSRSTRFLVCNTPSTIPTNAPAICENPVAQGGITATVASMGLNESSNLTNTAYWVQVTETDRLGNLARSNPFTYTPAGGSPVPFTPAANEPLAPTGRVSPQAFGVDLTAPEIVAIPDPSAATGTNPALAGFVRTGIDSIFSTLGNTETATTGNISASNAAFGVRVRDSRSGFYRCGAGTACFGSSASDVAIGTFQILRHRAPASPNTANNAVAENLINTSTTTGPVRANVMDAATVGGDPSIRQFSILVGGASARQPADLTVGASNNQAGYYAFSGTLADRAGNTTTIPTRRVAIDNAAPVLSSIVLPPILQGGQALSVTLQGTDDLEAVSAEVGLVYPQLGCAQGDDCTTGATTATELRFRRVPNFSTSIRTGLFHNPFASLADGKLATPVGAGLFFSGAASTPIPLIQNLQTVTAGNAPVAPTSAPTNVKPTAVTAQLADIRSMASPAGTSTGLGNAFSNTVTVSIPGASVTENSTAKNWTSTGAGIATWQVFSASTSSVEFRVQTPTSVTNPPFTAVYIVRREFDVTTSALSTTRWEYLGMATFAGTVDNGADRFFRYTFTPAAIPQGNGLTMAGFGGFDELRAIGVDAQGNGLSTRSTGVTSGNSITAFSVSTRTLLPAGTWQNQAGQASISDNVIAPAGSLRISSTITRPAGATGAVTYTCTSSNLVSATVVNNNDGTCDVVGAAAGSATITLSATGAASGSFSSNTISTTTTVTVAGVNALSSLAIANGTFATFATGSPNTGTLTATTAANTVTLTPTFNTGAGASQTATPMAYVARSSNTGVATVSCSTSSSTGIATCTVTGVASGTATITITGRAVGGGLYSNPTQQVITVTVP